MTHPILKKSRDLGYTRDYYYITIMKRRRFLLIFRIKGMHEEIDFEEFWN